MSDLHCDTCRYFDARARECHVNPPTMHPNSPAGIWPSVDRFDWCGEWERMELPIAEDRAQLMADVISGKVTGHK